MRHLTVVAYYVTTIQLTVQWYICNSFNMCVRTGIIYHVKDYSINKNALVWKHV